MNRSSFALFVALLIHVLVFLLLWIALTHIPSTLKHTQKKEHKLKISLKELPKKFKKSGTSKTTLPTPKHQTVPKGTQYKKITQQKPVIQPHKTVISPKRKLPQSHQKPKKKTHSSQQHKKPVIPLLEPKKVVPVQKVPKKSKPKDPLSWMYEDTASSQQTQRKKHYKSGGNLSQNIKELYGDTFGKLTPGQQQYIIDNQEIMRRITQSVLNRLAPLNIPRDLRVNRTNVVEFYLHPNGDISNLHLIKKSGYFILDDTTKEMIEYAYSRYPRPKEKTLIRYNVYYNLRY